MNNTGTNATNSCDHQTAAAAPTTASGGIAMPPGSIAAPASNPIAPTGVPQNILTASLQATAMGTGPAGGSVMYDISSLDPLQAHALQLTASAGLAPGPSTATGSQPFLNAGGITQQQIQEHNPFFVFQQQLQQQNATAFARVGSTPGAGATSAISTANPQSLLLPAVAAAAGPHAALATLASQAGGYAQLLAAQGLLPRQYLEMAASAAAPPALTQPLPSHQPFVPLATASIPNIMNDNANKRPADIPGTISNGNKKHKQYPPPTISSSTNGTYLGMNSALHAAPATNSAHSEPIAGSDMPPPKEASEADLNRMTPAERRRYERNLREQQRSYRISQQIKELRDILVDSKFPFKPNKYSILLSVVDYIKQLQSRAIMLDTEHSKLIKTIRETNDMVNSGTAPTSTDESVNVASTFESGSESEMLFVKGLDYQSVFDQCPAALGVAALDGRILECNMEFQTILGFPSREDVLKQSLFNLVQNHQDIFRAMAQMLKTAEEPIPDTPSQESSSAFHENNPIGGADHANSNPAAGANSNGNNGAAPVSSVAVFKDRFWTGPVTSKLNVKVRLGLSMIYIWLRSSLSLTSSFTFFCLVALDEHHLDGW